MNNIKIIKSNRKTMSLSINDELNIVVKAPYFVTNAEINSFVSKNEKWIEGALLRKKKQLEKYDIDDEKRNELIAEANSKIPILVERYSKIMGVKPTAVKITCAKKRFGSCSGKNSLCFSYYLMLYPKEAIEYVVVHELAHIKHHNHSKEFYDFVAKFMPDYKLRENLLKN